MRYLYSVLLYALLPFIALRMLWRSRQAPAYRQRMGERLGFAPPDRGRDNRPAIWVHAVSVGETLAAVPIIEALLERYPAHRVVVTTTTPTGSAQVQSLFGDRVFHVYAPWDLPCATGRFLRRIRPELLLIMETELWPNMLHLAAAHGCTIVLANARMSARSARGYARLSRLTRSMLSHLDVVACQSKSDGERLLSLGLPQAALEVTGSIKFDLALDEGLRNQVRILGVEWHLDEREVLVAASTHVGEDEQILEAFKALKKRDPNALLVLVPRHPERFERVGKLCQEAGWTLVTRSSGRAPGPDDDIVLGDTMGELLLLLGTGSVAVIGGSLVEHGGHNVLEASAWGVPAVTGPWMFNFAQISELLTTAGALVVLERPEQLAETLLELWFDLPRRRQMGAAGLEVVEDNRGALARLLALVDAQMASTR